MKKYIITEEQMDLVLSQKEKPMKKGIGLKIMGENDDYYYESKIKEFSDEEEFNKYKETLPENYKIIGVIDID
jgi:hypothetical protein